MGLQLAQLSPATQADVASKLPGFATASNPIDVTAALLTNSGLFGDVLPAVAQDPAADLFFLNIPVAGAGYDVDRFARDAAAFEASTGKPVAAWQDNVATPFSAHGLATFPNEGEAIAVLAQVAGHTELLRESRAIWPSLPKVQVPAGAQGFLNEVDSLNLLARHGVPTVPMHLCRTADEARAAFDAIGAPAVVKACSAEVPHKSEHGLEALNVQTREQAAELFERFGAKMDEMGVQRDGVIVAATRKGQREFMVGARMDPIFGPLVVVGDGGKYVETLKDCAVLLPPFSNSDVQAALRTLRIAPLLDGVRGEPPLDIQALADIVVAVGRVIAGAHGAIASLDLNPVLVGAASQGAVVVDALVDLSKTNAISAF